MNQKTQIRPDDVLRLKVIIVVVYGVLTIFILLNLGDSGIPLVSQLLLQVGSIIDGPPSQVGP